MAMAILGEGVCRGGWVKQEESDWEGDQSVSAAKKKKNKKRGKKKKKSELRGGENEEPSERDGLVGSISVSEIKPELVCLYHFTSTSSATQRMIKQQYDKLVKCNTAKGLTLAQVGEFANCLIEAKNELQHKSKVIKRKFSIIYKLELEQKRVEEDALVYNWLQQQLKLSPAYKKTNMEGFHGSDWPIQSKVKHKEMLSAS